MRVGSLFAGIGGFDLAARWMGWTTSWYSEIEPYACSIMAKNFPDATNLGDITKITSPPPVDILVGGFPCQDISHNNSNGQGINGPRSGLWSHYARLIDEARPQYVVAENVSNLRKRGLGRVLRDLASLGYDAEWHCVPAAYVGANHRRDRIWIVAYTRGSGRAGDQQEHPLLQEASFRESCLAACSSGPAAAAARGWDSIRRGEPGVRRDAHGIPYRVERIAALGNALVPVIPYLIFNAIAHAEASRSGSLSHF